MRRGRPRLVLLDLVLPGADGLELLETVFDPADLPVIFISAYGGDDGVARALERGAADYIVKPFSASELTARVRAALRRRDEPEPFALGDLAIDYARRRVTVGGRPVPGAADPDRVPAPPRALAERRPGRDPRVPAAQGVARRGLRPGGRARLRQAPAAQARGRPGTARLRRQRAWRRLPHAGAAPGRGIRRHGSPKWPANGSDPTMIAGPRFRTRAADSCGFGSSRLSPDLLCRSPSVFLTFTAASPLLAARFSLAARRYTVPRLRIMGTTRTRS